MSPLLVLLVTMLVWCVLSWIYIDRVFKYVEDCERCFFCQFMCKRDAIKVVPDYSSEHLMQSFDGCR